MQHDLHLDQVFALLRDWRKLPTYQLERRVDIVAAVFLRDFLASRLDPKVTLHERMIPEFPLHQALKAMPYVGIPENADRLADHVDFALCAKDRSTVFLVEFKTDMKSLRDGQAEYLEAASDLPFDALLAGFAQLRASPNRRVHDRVKFNTLAAELKRWGFDMDGDYRAVAAQTRVRVCYLSPLPPKDDEALPVAKYFVFSEFADFIEDAYHDSQFAALAAKSFREWTDGPVSEAEVAAERGSRRRPKPASER